MIIILKINIFVAHCESPHNYGEVPILITSQIIICGHYDQKTIIFLIFKVKIARGNLRLWWD